VAEWEERHGWEPYHVTRGFQKEDSVVTVLGVTSGPHQVVDFYITDANELIQLLAEAMHPVYSPYFPFINDCLLVLSPEHYDTLRKGGIKTKKQLRENLWGKCNKDMAPSLRKIIAMRVPYVGHLIGGTLGLVARGLNLITGTGLPLLPKFNSPDSFHVIVAGGPAGKFSSFCPGFGVGVPPMPSAGMNKAVSRKIDPVLSSEREQKYDMLPETSNGTNEILDPTSDNKAANFSLAQRTGEIKGDIALLDISKPGGGKLLDRLSERLIQKYPSVKFHRFSKPTFSRPAPEALQAKILQTCQSVIVALAD